MAQATFDIPAGAISNYMIGSSPPIDPEKIIRTQSVDVELFGPATTIAALTKLAHIVRGATGTLVGFEVAHMVAGTGDRTVSVDVKKSTGGGAFATVLSSVAQILVASTVRVPIAGVFSNATIVGDDILEFVVTLGGTTGSYPQGLIATLTFTETYT